MRECLEAWSSESADQLYESRFAAAATGRDAFDMESVLRKAAARLHAQATAMLNLGFEGALEAVVVTNVTRQVPFKNGFPKLKPCCALEVAPDDEHRKGGPFRCAPGGDAVLPADYKIQER